MDTAVLFCDLDRFKVVNDTLGHQAGDQLLVECARRLRQILRAQDTVARFGGDEFVILCTDVEDPLEVTAVAERVTAAVEEPFVISGCEFHISTSIGIAFSADRNIAADDLLRDADAAMYRAKEEGRARFVFFASEMRSTALERMHTEQALRRAITHGEMRLHFQPMIATSDGCVVGAEALVRWQRADELVAPDSFIGLAEETGLIAPLGEWVIDAVCAQVAKWERGGVICDDFCITVNVSLRQLDSIEFARAVERTLSAHGVEARRLCFELTESALADDRGTAAHVLRELRALGCALAIDDFGTGYSALAHLKRFPFDTIKVDRSFVSGLGRDPEDEAIVAAVVAIANALDLRLVGEGVETQAQADALRAMGVPIVQGYLYGRPMDEPSFERLLVLGRRPTASLDC